MALPFRQRIFLILVALTAVPTTLAVIGWALAVRTVAPSAGARVSLEQGAASARQMVEQIQRAVVAPVHVLRHQQHRAHRRPGAITGRFPADPGEEAAQIVKGPSPDLIGILQQFAQMRTGGEIQAQELAETGEDDIASCNRCQ